MKLSEAHSKRIDELLKLHNMNINQLAIKAGINDTTIRTILNGGSDYPSTKTIYFICIGFGISYQEFYDSKIFNMENLNED